MPEQDGLLSRLQAGDQTAIAQVIEMYGSRLFRTILAIIGDWQAAEEVVQDTFLCMCRRIHCFEQRSSLQTWLWRISINLAKNRRRVKYPNPADPFELGNQDAAVSPGPEESAINRESREELLGCLKRLPVKYRDPLVLYYLEDFGVGEISEMLDMRQNTVKSLLYRGRALLKREIEATGRWAYGQPG